MTLSSRVCICHTGIILITNVADFSTHFWGLQRKQDQLFSVWFGQAAYSGSWIWWVTFLWALLLLLRVISLILFDWKWRKKDRKKEHITSKLIESIVMNCARCRRERGTFCPVDSVPGGEPSSVRHRLVRVWSLRQTYKHGVWPGALGRPRLWCAVIYTLWTPFNVQILLWISAFSCTFSHLFFADFL